MFGRTPAFITPATPPPAFSVSASAPPATSVSPFQQQQQQQQQERKFLKATRHGATPEQQQQQQDVQILQQQFQQQVSAYNSEAASLAGAVSTLQSILSTHDERGRKFAEIARNQAETIARLNADIAGLRASVELAAAKELEKDVTIAALKRETQSLRVELETERSKPIGDPKLRDLPRLASGAMKTEELTQIETVLRDYLEAVRVAKEKKITEIRESSMCKICFEKDADALFLGCSHCCCCMSCASKLSACPICRKEVTGAGGGVARVIKS